MEKTIKHNNILWYEEAQKLDGSNHLQIICRGCTMIDREERWLMYRDSAGGTIKYDNSYLTLEEEPDNRYDPNAVMVVCRGEYFGTMGYVGKEFTPTVKEVLQNCTSYRVDMVNREEAGQREINLILTWI